MRASTVSNPSVIIRMMIIIIGDPFPLHHIISNKQSVKSTNIPTRCPTWTVYTHPPNVAVMLGQRLRRWPNIRPTLDLYLVRVCRWDIRYCSVLWEQLPLAVAVIRLSTFTKRTPSLQLNLSTRTHKSHVQPQTKCELQNKEAQQQTNLCLNNEDWVTQNVAVYKNIYIITMYFIIIIY